jgi:hypothetical protein
MRMVLAAHQAAGILRLPPVAWAVVFTLADVELAEAQARDEGDKARV